MGSRSRNYTSEFKHQALQLAKDLGSIAAASKKLGVPVSSMHGWSNRMKKQGIEVSSNKQVVSSAKLTESEAEELKRLRKENIDLKKTNIILKQAAAFFSQDHLK
jgi:transposase